MPDSCLLPGRVSLKAFCISPGPVCRQCTGRPGANYKQRRVHSTHKGTPWDSSENEL